MFVILSLGSFQVHIPVNEFRSCGSCVVILSVINTADSVCMCVYKRQKEKPSKRGATGRGALHVCIDEGHCKRCQFVDPLRFVLNMSPSGTSEEGSVCRSVWYTVFWCRDSCVYFM